MANTSSPCSHARRYNCLRRCDLLTVALAAVLCSASYSFSLWYNSRGVPASSILESTSVIVGATFCGGDDEHVYELDFEAHHTAEKAGLSVSTPAASRRALRAAPTGHRTPLPWPAHRGMVWAGSHLAHGVEAATAGEKWVRLDGDQLRFTDAGTIHAYVGAILQLVPASLRTALDVGAMHAGSWGADMLSRGVLAMSVAPWGASEDALVELALQRGVPAILAGRPLSRRLPYPARAFDMAHCGRCLVPWHLHDGLFLIEIDRVLRPGGYWVHSGTPESRAQEKAGIESAAMRMCWRKITEQRDISVWQKPINHVGCNADKNTTQIPQFCTGQNLHAKWDGEMEACITPLPEAATARQVTAEALSHDGETWKKRVGYYKAVINQLGQKSRFRNLLDMNAQLGGFAAALADDPVWVMNVVPAAAAARDTDPLGAIYDRGLIGVYQDWCVAMPTPPRSFDLLHADSLFTLYKDRCEMENVLLEMDRILRPDRTVIIRDDIDVLVKIKNITDRMRWDSQIVDNENSPDEREKLLLAVKTYWTTRHDQDEEQ